MNIKLFTLLPVVEDSHHSHRIEANDHSLFGCGDLIQGLSPGVNWEHHSPLVHQGIHDPDGLRICCICIPSARQIPFCMIWLLLLSISKKRAIHFLNHTYFRCQKVRFHSRRTQKLPFSFDNWRDSSMQVPSYQALALLTAMGSMFELQNPSPRNLCRWRSTWSFVDGIVGWKERRRLGLASKGGSMQSIRSPSCDRSNDELLIDSFVKEYLLGCLFCFVLFSRVNGERWTRTLKEKGMSQSQLLVSAGKRWEQTEQRFSWKNFLEETPGKAK